MRLKEAQIDIYLCYNNVLMHFFFESGKLRHKIHKKVCFILSQVKNNVGSFVEIG
jgi:hypothetical protein